MANGDTAEKKESEKIERIRIPLLLPMALVVLILLGTAVGSIYWMQHRHVSERMRVHVDNAQRMLQIELANDAELMRGLIDFIEDDEDIRTAWLAKDRDKLLQHTDELFKEIRSKYRVTHFYFIDPERTCYLRVHNPARHGDHIGRFTMDRAFRRNELSYGIELGPYGTFTLRVVYPWIIDGKRAGYIELGEEIEHITPKLKGIVDCEILFVIDKSYLDRAKWEEGSKMTGREGDWDRFEQFVVTDGANKQITPTIGEVMTRHEQRHEQSFFETVTNNGTFHCGFAPLLDASGRKVGKIIVMNDVSPEKASLRMSATILATTSTVVGGLLFAFFYFFIGRIQNKLIKGRNDLEEEIDEHKRTEEKLNKTLVDLKRFNDLAVGRELRMTELKAQINGLLCELGRKEEYAVIDQMSETEIQGSGGREL